MLGPLREKDLLLTEVHHRVKNNLQLISSMPSLQAREAQEGTLAHEIAQTRGRIRAMAMFHERLYESPDLGDLPFGNFARYLVQRLLRAYEAEGHAIEAEIDCDDTALGVTQAVPRGIILNELVSNALQHAYRSGWAASYAWRSIPILQVSTC